ncbi:MAG: leucine-rich repeat domain-containing protein, partial [Verrucomicrobiota bacterium]
MSLLLSGKRGALLFWVLFGGMGPLFHVEAQRTVVTRVELTNDVVMLQWTGGPPFQVIQHTDSLYLPFTNLTDALPGSNWTMNVEERARGYFRLIGTEPVLFGDPAVEAAVRNGIVNKLQPTNLVFNLDLEGITFLDVSGQSVTNPAGLDCMSGLDVLLLDNNQIGDIAPLAGLTNLTFLDLQQNQIVDLTPLSGVTNLTFLDVAQNMVSNLTPLAGMRSMDLLFLFDNAIQDLAPLSNLTEVTTLDITDNQVVDLAPLSAMSRLTDLVAAGNMIVDLSPLSNLLDLFFVDLEDNAVVDISPLIANAMNGTLDEV